MLSCHLGYILTAFKLLVEGVSIEEGGLSTLNARVLDLFGVNDCITEDVLEVAEGLTWRFSLFLLLAILTCCSLVAFFGTLAAIASSLSALLIGIHY